MIVSAHAKHRYKERIEIEDCQKWGKDYTTHRITEHLKKCRPVTDIELTYIRKTKKNRYTNTDTANAKHYIDPDTMMIFVVITDKNEDTIITCYHAPYLRFTQETIKNDRENERNQILDIFQQAGHQNSCMRWAVSLYYLAENGYAIYSHGLPRTLTLREAKGILVQQVREGGTRPKIISGGIHTYTWHKLKNWCFHDFNILSPDDFDNQYSTQQQTP
jgi:hypothetical protein